MDLLAWKHCGERHTSANLKSELKDVAADFGIKEDHISGCTTDNAKNASNAADEHVERKGTRAAHTIQLCVRAGTALPVVKEILDKSSAVVGHFKHSTVAIAALRSKQTQISKKNTATGSTLPNSFRLRPSHVPGNNPEQE